MVRLPVVLLSFSTVTILLNFTFDENAGKNEFEGSIPSEIGQIEALEVLSLGKCLKLSHDLNCFLALLSHIFILSENNAFSSNIPEEIGNLDTLEILSLRKWCV